MSKLPKLDTVENVLAFMRVVNRKHPADVRIAAAHIARAVRTLQTCERRRDSLSMLCHKQDMREACGPAEVLEYILADGQKGVDE